MLTNTGSWNRQTQETEHNISPAIKSKAVDRRRPISVALNYVSPNWRNFCLLDADSKSITYWSWPTLTCNVSLLGRAGYKNTFNRVTNPCFRSPVCDVLYSHVCLLVTLGLATAKRLWLMRLSESTGMARDHVIKFTRWQHSAVGRDARFAVPGKAQLYDWLDAEGEFTAARRINALSDQKRPVVSVLQHGFSILTAHRTCVPARCASSPSSRWCIMIMCLLYYEHMRILH